MALMSGLASSSAVVALLGTVMFSSGLFKRHRIIRLGDYKSVPNVIVTQLCIPTFGAL